MIYYFSGTRNSMSVAMRLADAIGAETRFIPHCSPYMQSAEGVASVGFVFPVYAWGVPPIVLDFIARLPQEMVDSISGGIPVWAVAVCGDETGMAIDMLCKALRRRGITLSAAWSVIMPNVYVLLPGFGVDKAEVERQKLLSAGERIRDIAGLITRKEWKKDVHVGSFPRLKTALIYPLFRRWGVDTRRWHSTEECTGCGMCARVCPVRNISMAEGRPKWGSDCTSCCACFHACPTGSVQYGAITRGMKQFKGPGRLG